MNQFIHMEVYAREASKLKSSGFAKKGTKRARGSGQFSARQIVAEAMRELGSHPHVLNALKPISLFGDIKTLATELDALKPIPGVRKDAPILICGVASAPWLPGDIRSVTWRVDVVKFLSEKFGSSLVAVIGHDDENYDHVHFYIRNPDFSPIKTIHPGLLAQGALKAMGGSVEMQKNAFKGAMSSFQDAYQNAVAMKYGQARLGPARQRVSRQDWIQHVQIELKKKEKIKQIQMLEDDLKKERKSLCLEREEVKTQKSVLNNIFRFLSDKIVDSIPAAIYESFVKAFRPASKPELIKAIRPQKDTFSGKLNEASIGLAKDIGANSKMRLG